MKLMINYDFFEAIRNVNEPLTPLKIVRNNKYKYLFNASLCAPIGLMMNANAEEIAVAILISQSFNCLMDLGINKIIEKYLDVDMFADKSADELKRLVPKLKELNVSTNYDLLLQSELYEKKYKIEFNESKIPSLMQEKYILVPSYSFSGEVLDTSIKQEHEVGTKRYVLSIGEPEKRYKMAFSNANA